MDKNSLVKMAVGATVAVAGAGLALPVLGFTSAGVGAGTIAAGIQSQIGCVAAGSTFATLQSAGAAGMAFGTKLILGGAGAVFGKKWF
ncbi:hypothetical protein TNIN_299931 [Trichonephila inaurata madagascariensis]|uniref:Uncharacterized protein n=1 Tax=Trichonephila inaurata madagascariensis TaxID=2747483 RepID=A0A8X6XCT8_9ARAC|nr:hypothetical protein TNIN_299931 [Trichonephila inaurata madagascariensis]